MQRVPASNASYLNRKLQMLTLKLCRRGSSAVRVLTRPIVIDQLPVTTTLSHVNGRTPPRGTVHRTTQRSTAQRNSGYNARVDSATRKINCIDRLSKVVALG